MMDKVALKQAFLPEFVWISPAYQSTIPPYVHLSLTPEMCENPDQAAHYHTPSLKVQSFISDLPLSWLQCEEIILACLTTVLVFMF
jgi:hypothetical protein